MEKVNKKWAIIGIVLLIFVMTNPGIKRFKDYNGVRSYRGLMRTQNWFVFSVYESGYSGKKYLGILFNFIPLN